MTEPQPNNQHPYPTPPNTPQWTGPRAPVPAGSSAIDEALAALAAVKDAPPAQQVAPLAQVHQVLRETLDSIGDV